MALASILSTMRDKRIFLKVNDVTIKTDFKFPYVPTITPKNEMSANIESDVVVKLRLMLQRTAGNPSSLDKVKVERKDLRYVGSILF